jgi:predicted amidohydrolase YtcJ
MRLVPLAAALAALVTPALAQDCERRLLAGRFLDGAGGEARAVLVEAGRFAGVLAEVPDDPDLPAGCVTALPEGAVALPGLTDGHAHLIGVGLREMMLNLDDVRSLAELKGRLAAEAAATSGTIVGRGWLETVWPEGRMPTRDDLDQAAPGRAVLLTRADGHALVASSAALAQAGIGDEASDPEGGRIVRDEAGRATGLLIDAAMTLTDGLAPRLDDRRRREALAEGARIMAARGWTGVQNMSVEAADLPIIEELARRGELPLRVHSYVTPDVLPSLDGRRCDPTGLACVQGVKLYVDGALGSRGAWLFEPYADEPGTTGLQLIAQDEALAAYAAAAAKGLQVTTHAIGDRGNATVLDWYARAMPEGGRWRIEHAQVVRPADVPRFSRLGVIASMQPSHAIGDLRFAPDRLGDARLDWAYAWASLRGTGAVVVGGSDAPVEKGDPLIELYAATERRALDGTQGPDWRAREALSRTAALDAFTRAAAYAVFEEEGRGTIGPGKAADLSVFCGDPFGGPDAAQPLFTMLGGRIVSGDADAPCEAP